MEEEVVRHSRDHVARHADRDEVRAAREEPGEGAGVRGVDLERGGAGEELRQERHESRFACRGRPEVDDRHGHAGGARRLGDGVDAGVDDLDRAVEERGRRRAHRATS